MTQAAQRYHDMSDEELIDFVAARMPKCLWWVQQCPRSVMVRESIIEELGRNPLFRLIEENQPQ